MKGLTLSCSQLGTSLLGNQFVTLVEQLDMLTIIKCATTPCGCEHDLHHLCLHLIDARYKK
jgi:hypothetical protein